MNKICFAYEEGRCKVPNVSTCKAACSFFKTNLRQAFEENGFSYTKCIKGFQERGYIETTIDSEKKRRSQMQKRIQGVNVRAICVNLSIVNTSLPEDDFWADPKVEPMM